MASYRTAISSIIFHCSSLTGITDRRGRRARSKFFNSALAFIFASVTGRASGLFGEEWFES